VAYFGNHCRISHAFVMLCPSQQILQSQMHFPRRDKISLYRTSFLSGDKASVLGGQSIRKSDRLTYRIRQLQRDTCLIVRHLFAWRSLLVFCRTGCSCWLADAIWFFLLYLIVLFDHIFTSAYICAFFSPATSVVACATYR